MMADKYRIQILHHEEVFETRELALSYLSDFYKPSSLEAEPVFVKYGDSRNPNAILAFGTSNAAPGSYFAIDIAKSEEQIGELAEIVDSNKEELEYVAEILDGVVKSTGLTLDDNKIENKIAYEPDSRDNVIGTAETIAQAIDLLSKYTQNGFTDNKLSVADTESVTLIYTVNPEGGKILKAKVNISSDGDTDDLNFNNNIIGIKNDGLYAASNLAYDDARHQLIFTTSGYKNGRYQDDAIVQRVDLGEHTKLVADNEGKTVKLVITEDAARYTSTISADLQIADRENNILKASDGKVYVDGTAKNIKYGESTVAATLTGHKNKLNELETSVGNAAKSAHVEGGQTDTFETVVSTLSDGGAKVTGNVRLGSENSIVVRNGGLEANITVDVDTTTNKLIVTIGNQTIVKTLPGVELFKSAEYNDANEELIITFITGNTLVIPIHGIIHTWDVLNPSNSPINLTKTVVTGGVDTLTGDIKLRSTDNLIAKENGHLYVSDSNINNKVANETSRATAAEQELSTAIQNLSNNVDTKFDDVSDAITNVRDSLTEESTRAKAAEAEVRAIASHADETATEAKDNVTELNSTVAALSTSLSTLETTVDGISESITEIPVLRNKLNEEITNRTNKDTEIEGSISAVETSVTTEKNRATTAEEAIVARIAHDISDVNAAITAEQTRAEAAEQANATKINELDEKIGAGSEQTLADAKAYTDTKIFAEQTSRETKDTEIETSIATAVRDASDDATAKANAAKTEANAYTDEQVLAEKNRAVAAEQANADAITALTTEVDKKVESVEIVKNSQSDLQYVLKVDGVDVSEINIPKDQFLKNVSYNPTSKEITFEFETSDGVVTTVVNVSDLVDTYTAGNGLTLTDNKFAVKLNEDSESYLTVSEEGIKLLGVDAKFAEQAQAANTYADNVVAAEKARAEAAEQANAEAVTTESTRAQAAEQANADAIVAEKTRAEASEQANAEAITGLENELNNVKFVTKETDTIKTTMAKEAGEEMHVLSSDVKLKTVSGQNANIIKSDANGLYATVTFNYDKASNKITFNDGNGEKTFELNNFGIIQDAFYDSENKSIVLVVKKDDATTERIVIPVADLVNTWTVQNDVNSPIVLTKTPGENGDVLSAQVTILNNENNLLVNNNGALFVDGDCNSHKALWGSEVTSVQGVINILRESYGSIDEIKQDIADLQESDRNIKETISVVQNDLSALEQRVSANETKIAAIQEGQDSVEQLVETMNERVNTLNERVDTFGDRIDQVEEKTETVLETVNGMTERLDRIEQVLEQLIDFGEYDINI